MARHEMSGLMDEWNRKCTKNWHKCDKLDKGWAIEGRGFAPRVGENFSKMLPDI